LVTLKNHNLILEKGFTQDLNCKVLYELGKNSSENQLKFQSLYTDRKTSLKWAYVCLLFFPGTHYAFMGKWQTQILFWVTLGGGLIWWVMDIFRLRQLVEENNLNHQNQILREINAQNVFIKFTPEPITSISDIQLV